MDHPSLELNNDYRHHPLNLELFIRHMLRLIGSFAATMIILPMREGNYAAARTVQSDQLFTERIEYTASGIVMKAYVAQPKAMKVYEDALKANSIRYEKYMYEGVNHAFHNDTSAARYIKDAATLAWSCKISFLTKFLA